MPEPLASADDETIRAAVAVADMAALLPALAACTGDATLLRDELREPPSPMTLVAPVEDSPTTTKARAAAVEALTAVRDGVRAFVPTAPGDDALRSMIDVATGGAADVDAYLPLFVEELGLGGIDARAPGWTVDAVAPGRELHVVVIGAGMSGLVAALRLRQAGVRVTVLDKNDDVGGTWLENTYPGCRVDVPNHFYSYSFAQKPDWPQLYSSQGVLLDYFREVADRFGLRELIRFGAEVDAMVWDEDAGEWELSVRTASHDGGAVVETVRAHAVVSAVGQLNRPSLPDIAGRDRFAGPSFHTARWRHDVDLDGARVAVIGTGASAMQAIPAIAERCGEVLVFQRTPAWLVPTPDYHETVGEAREWLFANVPGYAEWYRFVLFWRNSEGMLPLVAVDPAWSPPTQLGQAESVSMMNEMLRQFAVAYLGEQFGDDPELLEKVTPHYPVASKRVIRDNGIWARTLKRDDVTLETDGITEITEKGIVTVDADGVATEHPVDVIVYGTGFQASNFLTPMRVVGRSGVELHDRWGGDARAYLGVTIPDFPNLFLMYGPNTNIVINGSIIFFSECETQYLVGCLRMLLDEGATSLDCRPEVHDAFNAEIDEGNLQKAWGVATVNSWYRNATGRSAQNWPFTLLDYWQRTRTPNPADYTLR